MSIRAIVTGTAAGALLGVAAAVVLALVVYHTGIASTAVNVALWALDALVSAVAGFCAARLAPSGAALQGVLAALTLALLGNVAAVTAGVAAGPLWAQLALAATMGLAGGLAAVMV
jgi:hydroxylaminobenzene mutase